ncbi:ThuA domain-containing protein [Rubinisphaera margarita]|uniref:ThuA domain-containing protein n=1 Tax=Rubinisphaera margarita TaxID=2909586 RepID=UPI001EE8D223|nr:ThuA domain-containing protein [Rubinisphaera margarita]MCG6156235.1 ThuA domain-containing protein [Rubinisphaera margarita]
MRLLVFLTLLVSIPSFAAAADQQYVVYEGEKGPGVGKHIVLISGDDEYRSEEAMPMLGQILARHHGFKCTVLFAVNPETGEIEPTYQKNIPGMENLQTADLVILFTRFRALPDEDMKYFDDYLKSGKPIIGLRTSTHAFNFPKDFETSYAHYGWNNSNTAWPGGFGKEVFGETWYTHHGKHKSESTRGIIEEDHADHPILNGVENLWGPTDVYGVRELPADAEVLVRGQVLTGMKPDDPPVEGEKNDPMMPIAWTRKYETSTGKTSRIFCTTLCSSIDLEDEDLRRMLVNASFWCLGMEKKVPERANVEILGEYDPSFYGFGSFRKGLKPSDFAW